MNITVFGKYKVEFKGIYSYRNGEDDFSTDDYCEIKIVDGSELLKNIQRELQHYDTIEFSINDNVVYIDRFCPHTGEASSIWIIILEEIKE